VSTYLALPNILWLPLGVLLAVHHLVWASACFVTIIGIPFAFQHIKLAQVGEMHGSTFALILELVRETHHLGPQGLCCMPALCVTVSAGVLITLLFTC
jgi:hypothetical protein